MARRKQSVSDELFDIASRLPWWLGVLLAGVIYLVMHYFSVAEAPTVTGPGDMGAVVVRHSVKMLTSVLQYVVPFIFIVGAGASAIGSYRRRQLLVSQTGIKSIRALDWRTFEQLVGAMFRSGGYTVSENEGAGPDGGVDLVLRKGTETYLVQCKQWKAFKVGVSIVRELYGLMAAEGAAGGFVVTSGVFTQDAKAFAAHKNIELIDGEGLGAMLPSPAPVRPLTKESSICTKCKSVMVKRIARRGKNTGDQF
jgi:restriction system protein